MADNRIYVNCRWCCEGKDSEWLEVHPYEKSCTLARFGFPAEWQATTDTLAEFMENHMHRDEPDWWENGYYYNPFDFEYEDTNEKAKIRREKIRKETGCPPFLSEEEVTNNTDDEGIDMSFSLPGETEAAPQSYTSSGFTTYDTSGGHCAFCGRRGCGGSCMQGGS